MRNFIFLAPLLSVSSLAFAQDTATCPTGQSLHIKEHVVKPSRIEDVLVDTHKHSAVEVHESQGHVTIPATWTWIPRPENYMAPKFINIPHEHSREGEAICVNQNSRAMLESFDTIQKLDGSTFTQSYHFLGQAIIKQQCVTRTGTTPIMSVVKMPYDPEFMEKDGQIRLLMKGTKLMIRKTPKIMKKMIMVRASIRKSVHTVSLQLSNR